MEGRKDEGVEIRNKGREKKVYGEEVIIEEGEVKKKKIMEIQGIGDKVRMKGIGIEKIKELKGVGENYIENL